MVGEMYIAQRGYREAGRILYTKTLYVRNFFENKSKREKCKHGFNSLLNWRL
jgi:hypothetical protein